MTDLPKSVHELTEPWVYVVRAGERNQYQAQDFRPLLEILQRLVAPNSGRTRGGANDPANRSVIDVKALDLLIHIEDVVKGRLAQWRIPPVGLVVDVLAFYNRLEALRTSRGISEAEYVPLRAYLDKWAQNIWDLVEPPLQVPLKEATCPRCDRAKWVNDDGEQTDALMVSYREGNDIQAECRWRNCDYLATGTKALLELGFHVGATVDPEALKEMGVEV